MSRFELVNEISQQARDTAMNVVTWEQLREQRIAEAKAYFSRIALKSNEYSEVDGTQLAAAISAYRRRYKLSANALRSLLGLDANQFKLYQSGEVSRIRVSTHERLKRFGIL